MRRWPRGMLRPGPRDRDETAGPGSRGRPRPRAAHRTGEDALAGPIRAGHNGFQTRRIAPNAGKGSLHGHVRGPTGVPLERDLAGKASLSFPAGRAIGLPRDHAPGLDHGGRGRPRGGGEALPDRAVRRVRGAGRGRDSARSRRPAMVPAQDPGRAGRAGSTPRRWPRSRTPCGGSPRASRCACWAATSIATTAGTATRRR